MSTIGKGAAAQEYDIYGWRLGLLGAVWLADIALLPFAPFSIVWSSFYPLVLWIALMGTIWTIYTFWRPAAEIVAAVWASSELLLFVLGGAIFNYLGFMAHRPLIDAQLLAVDRAIGFDWHVFVAWISSIRGVNDVLVLAYASSLIQVGIAVIFLGLTGRFARLHRFVLGFMVCALITIVFWIAFPSFGAYIYYYGVGEAVPTSGIAVDAHYAQALIDMHNGIFKPLRYDEILGLIGFPSFHTGLAILCAYALRGVPWLGPLALAANAAVLLSVPAQGGHHLVDMFGGAGAAILAIWLTARLSARATTTLPVNRSFAAATKLD